MADFGNDVYPDYDPSTAGGFDAHPFLDTQQTSDAEGFYTEMPDSLAAGWAMAGHPSHEIEPSFYVPTLPITTNVTNYGKYNNYLLAY